MSTQTPQYPNAPAPTPSITRAAGALVGAVAARLGYFEFQRGFLGVALPKPKSGMDVLTEALESAAPLFNMGLALIQQGKLSDIGGMVSEMLVGASGAPSARPASSSAFGFGAPPPPPAPGFPSMVPNPGFPVVFTAADGEKIVGVFATAEAANAARGIAVRYAGTVDGCPACAAAEAAERASSGSSEGSPEN